MLDSPCGSFFWMRHLIENVTNSLDPDFKYHGIDIVKSILLKSRLAYSSTHPNWKFSLIDFTSQPVPENYDLIFSRDVLQHLSLEKIIDGLERLSKSNSKYLLVTSYVHSVLNTNIKTGKYFPANLFISPFNLKDHLEIFEETTETNKTLEKHLVLYDIEKHLKLANFDQMRKEVENFRNFTLRYYE